MSARRDRLLLIGDHPGPPSRVVVAESLHRRADVLPLALPRWDDSTLCRGLRLHALPPQARRQVEDRAARLLALLHDALAAEGVGEGEWQYLRQVLETHTVTPIVEAGALVRHTAQRLGAGGLVALARVGSREWWSGKHMAEAAARDVADEMGLRLRVRCLPAGLGAMVGAMGPGLRARLRARALLCRSLRLLRGFASPGAAASPPLPADVLLLCSGPVIEALAYRLACAVADRGRTVLVVRDPLAPTGGTGGVLLPLGGMVTEGERRAAERLAAGGAARAREMLGRLAPELSSGERQVLAARLAALETRDRPLAGLLRADAERLLDAVRPAVVVAFSFLPRLLTPYVVAARERGIGAVCCQHGLISGLDYACPWFDRLLVFNLHTAVLVRGRIPGDRKVRVVGNPGLDRLVGRPPEPLRLAPGDAGAVVLVATQPNDPPGSEADPGWWFAAVARACGRLGAYVEAKLHPQQRADVEGEMYRRAMEAAGTPGRVIPHGQADLGRLIAGCDAFVSQFSSSVLEAIVLGKPAVFVDLREGPPFYPFDDFGMAIRAREVGEVEEALRSALGSAREPGSGEAREQFFAKHLDPLDGRALERIAQAVETAAEGGG